MLVMRDLLARRLEAAALTLRRGQLRYGFDRPFQTGSGGRGGGPLAVAEDRGGLAVLAGLRRTRHRPGVQSDPEERRGEAVTPRTRRDCTPAEGRWPLGLASIQP